MADLGRHRIAASDSLQSVFSRVARYSADQLGRAQAFIFASVLTVVWLAVGPAFGFSDAWQLLINTATTIATFLMLFLLQHTQNRDTLELNLKLDELIRANKEASNRLLSLEKLDETQLSAIKGDFDGLADRE